MRRIIICGDRNYDNWQNMIAVFDEHLDPKNDIIIEGGAWGADLMAEAIGLNRGFDVEMFEADWNTYGRAAGPIRNTEMIGSNIDTVFAFHKDITKSKGTKDTVKRAERSQITVHLVK